MYVLVQKPECAKVLPSTHPTGVSVKWGKKGHPPFIPPALLRSQENSVCPLKASCLNRQLILAVRHFREWEPVLMHKIQIGKCLHHLGLLRAGGICWNKDIELWGLRRQPLSLFARFLKPAGVWASLILRWTHGRQAILNTVPFQQEKKNPRTCSLFIFANRQPKTFTWTHCIIHESDNTRSHSLCVQLQVWRPVVYLFTIMSEIAPVSLPYVECDQ